MYHLRSYKWLDMVGYGWWPYPCGESILSGLWRSALATATGQRRLFGLCTEASQQIPTLLCAVGVRHMEPWASRNSSGRCDIPAWSRASSNGCITLLASVGYLVLSCTVSIVAVLQVAFFQASEYACTECRLRHRLNKPISIQIIIRYHP